ncbi:4Fe-4S single cluster domain-containing protein [Vibrio sp. CAU 1672]|uniref:4Fe-4S single cluster domain-containing protein n=1 Tax=Vibrio sp. CAU 1672 TaxID=3032594 RepID=UPI0023DC7FC1|nr:4Fe-4S single cluster domain-containing protein [Vibrio sp. CAU 1672]MDF2152530.1 4Fe-4S single cluster domain-containing protein [Vibrio sp. CAU 1672]
MVQDYGEYFNLAHIEPLSHIYGPGDRFVVWFQGCALACDGCWNREMWSFKSNNLVHKEKLLEEILDTPGIRGVTFLGGEPLHQADNLWWLIEQIRMRSNLTVFLFTGYEEDELLQQGNLSHIHQFCDIAAIGRYRSEQRNVEQQWIGSDNQVVVYPKSSRENTNPCSVNEVEIIIDEDESLRILGFPDNKLIEVLCE